MPKPPNTRTARRRTRTFGWVKSPTGEPADATRRLRVVLRAMECFGSQDSAKAWMTTPNIDLGDRNPLDLLNSELGADEVMHLLDVIAQRKQNG